jgi:hypothetical protein
MYLIIHVVGHTRIWLCMCFTMPLLGHTCIWLYMYLTMHVLSHTCIWLCLYVHYTCIWLYLYSKIHIFDYTCILHFPYLIIHACYCICIWLDMCVWLLCFLLIHVFGHACWLCVCLIIHVFDHAFIWLYTRLIIHVCIWLCTYLVVHVFDYRFYGKAEPPLYISIPGLRCSLDSVIELPYLRRTGADGCHVSMDHTCIWLYVYVLCMHLIGHVFDYACIWLWLFLIIHVFYYTCISRYMYVTTIVFDYTCIFLYMYLTVHVNSTRGRNNPHSKSGRARDDYLQPFSHSIPMVIGWAQVSPGRDQIKSSSWSANMKF